MIYVMKCIYRYLNVDYVKIPESKDHGANMGPHVGHMNLAIWG